MTQNPQFERFDDHEFKEKEKVYIIDTNQFDIYEATIVSIVGNQYSIHYTEYPDDDETLEGTERILPVSRINTRICNQQETYRSSKALDGEEDEDDSDPFGGDADDKEDDFVPNSPMKSNKQKMQKKQKKDKKKKEPPITPRPEGARSNPTRNSRKVYKDYSDSESD